MKASSLTIAVDRRIFTKLLILRHLHSSPPPPPPPMEIHHPLTHPIYTIWAANTCLGKTLVSAGLSMSFLLSPSSTSVKSRKFVYLKPVQTGFPADSDSRFVYGKFSEYFLNYRPHFSVYASNCILRASVPACKALLGSNGKFGCGVESSVLGNSLVGENENNEKNGTGLENLGWYEERKLQGGDNGNAVSEDLSELICKTMYGWKEAVSPHLAAEREGGMEADSELLEVLKRCLWVGSETGFKMDVKEKVDVMCVVETAGGVASPGPSGVLQCDLYRPFRLPAILVGDGKLGGISGTISAYESLRLRGYDVVAVIFEDHGLVNQAPLSSYLGRRVPVLVLPPIPQDMSDNLVEWFDKSKNVFSSLKEIMVSAFHERIHRLHEMPKKALKIFWWPFTQHNLVPPENVTVIDSRCGENFSVHKVTGTNSIAQQFDACASWWTQGPDSVLQIELARALGYTAARYGHIMFPENVYEPALECAELLLEGVGKGWASRTYFSDNGSTAIEIALKMAFRKFLFDHEILLDLPNKAETRIDLKVIALRGSYHGDTLGAMEAQAPSPYTGIYQQPWYKGRGLFLDPPTASLSGGIWKLRLPKKIDAGSLEMEHFSFNSRDEIFAKRRDSTGLADMYSSYVLQNLSLNDNCRGPVHIGALIIEPVVQGAGGMELIDPLFQRILVKECQVRKIPVIFDEVFTGFWRLGAESAAELLCCQPDISCFAKLMTGGIIPLAATLASEATFEAFLGESKLKALLHGHSYSAHAMGCAAAVKSIKWFKNSKTNHNLISGMRLRELWDAELVDQMSFHPAVQRVVALGTICAIELRAEGCNTGYASLYAASLVQKLREDGIYMRPLGNVIYLMCGPLTSPHICHDILEKVYSRLEEFSQRKSEFSQRKSETCELI